MALLRALASPYGYAAMGGLGVYLLLQTVYYMSDVRDPPIIESPLKSLVPKLSNEVKPALPYPPDAIPGARDVVTPYGTIRVYEWGPEDGKKVLFLHGISTPCISCKGIAQSLVDKAGCRVILFDLFGRGFSDCPTQVQHDLSLYTSQILLVISSSPVPWTGVGNEFTIVGYSLGGGIVTSFASYFTDLVSSIVAIAPAGLMRDDRISWKSRFLYGTEGVMPETLIRWLVGRRLGKGKTVVSKIKAPEKPKARSQLRGRRPREKDGMIEEDESESDTSSENSSAAASGVFAPNPIPILGEKYPDSTETIVTKWQLENQNGFIPAFISCIRHAPIYARHQYFLGLAEKLDQWNDAHSERKKKVLLVLGSNDPVVLESETIPDWQQYLGQRNFDLLTLDAGHEVPISKAEEISARIITFWEETGW